ncbi:MAG: hypothetical protein WEC34_08040 [Acidimicrobiia bacterium]
MRRAGGTNQVDVLAAIEDRVVGLSSTTGEVVRVFAVAPDGRDISSVAVAPNGRVVYYTVGEQCGPTPEVWRVPVSGNKRPRRVTAAGSGPRVSPDGRLLAYTGARQSETLLGCVDYDTLVVRNLRTGVERRLELGDRLSSVGVLAWLPNSEQVVVARGPGAFAVEVTGRELHVGEPIVLPGNGLGFLGTGAAVTSIPGLESTRVVTIELPTGTEGFTLVEIPAALGLVDVGRSGGGFLLFGPLADSTQGWDLYHATVANPDPVRLASQVQSAVWLPPRPSVPKGLERIMVDGVSLAPGDTLGIGFHPTPRPARVVVDPPTAAVAVCPGTNSGEVAVAPNSSSWADVWPAGDCRSVGRSGMVRLPSRSEHVLVVIANRGGANVALRRVELVYDQHDYLKFVHLPTLAPGDHSARVILPIDLLDNAQRADVSCSCGLEQPVRLELVDSSGEALRTAESIGANLSFLDVGRDERDQRVVAARVMNVSDAPLAPTVNIEISPWS